ncbi:unnamed protein product [Closterium sp. Naga37s-1]|nr:unnamed protein product [Closterium sp. Naga37s-1]
MDPIACSSARSLPRRSSHEHSPLSTLPSPSFLQFAPPKPLRLWAPVSSTPLSAALLLFQHGFTALRLVFLPTNSLRGAFAPPKPLRLWVPVSSSQLSTPVLLFQHGFAAKTHFYSQLLSRIASHGFIVVAPQVATSCNRLPTLFLLLFLLFFLLLNLLSPIFVILPFSL